MASKQQFSQNLFKTLKCANAYTSMTDLLLVLVFLVVSVKIYLLVTGQDRRR